MRDPMLLTAAILASTCGMAWLSLAMKAHWQQVCGDVPIPKGTPRTLRLFGAGALLGSFFLCLAADHPSIAALVWVMSLAVSAATVAFTLTWRPAFLAWMLPQILRREVIRTR